MTHGIKQASPEKLVEMLRDVLDEKQPIVYESTTTGLSEMEQEVLKSGGLNLTRTSTRDLVGETAVHFAALVECSLTAEQVATKVGMTASRIRQLIKSREIFSFYLNRKRLVPAFQHQGDQFVPNIETVNKAIPEGMHPVGIEQWFHQPNTELYIDEDMETLRSPLQWLAEGREPSKVAFLAENL